MSINQINMEVNPPSSSSTSGASKSSASKTKGPANTPGVSTIAMSAPSANITPTDRVGNFVAELQNQTTIRAEAVQAAKEKIASPGYFNEENYNRLADRLLKIL